jgi:predicted enzyme related to lactoylglutathione lyase
MGTTANTGKHAAEVAAQQKSATPYQQLKDYVSWFEIPAYDLLRAKAFYDHVYGFAMEASYNGDYGMAYFPAESGVGGAVVQGPGCIPNDCGALLYLNAGKDLDGMLSRVEAAGGRIVMGRTLISESAGSFALFVDSEGNRLAFHEAPSKKDKKVAAPKKDAAKTSGSAKAEKAAKKPARPKAGVAAKKTAKKRP